MAARAVVLAGPALATNGGRIAVEASRVAATAPPQESADSRISDGYQSQPGRSWLFWLDARRWEARCPGRR